MLKGVVLEILDYLRWQVANDRCTHEELRAIYCLLTERIGAEATAEDIGEYYCRSAANVKNVISRNAMPKPKRRVYHNFAAFLKCVPKTWRRGKSAE